MNIQWFPHSKTGKWSSGLFGAALITWLFLMIFARGLDVIPGLAVYILGVATVVVAFLAFITSIFALFKAQDRAITVILAFVLGLIVLLIIVISVILGL